MIDVETQSTSALKTMLENNQKHAGLPGSKWHDDAVNNIPIITAELAKRAARDGIEIIVPIRGRNLGAKKPRILFDF